MNLWAKRLGQLTMLSVALFFFSCEDENSIGYPNPNKKFQVSTIEIPLTSSVVLLDSVITDNKAIQSYQSLVGSFNDPELGNVRAVSNLQLIPAFVKKLPLDAVYDSAVLQVRLTHYAYGLTNDATQSFTVHQITGDSLNRLVKHAYYSTNSIEFSPEVLATAEVNLDYEQLKENYPLAVSQQDTVLINARLNDEFGGLLLQLTKPADANDKTDFNSDVNNGGREELREFIFAMKGITLVPQQSQAILGLDIFGTFSRIIVHYHTPSDTLSAPFAFNPASFTTIEADRSTTELAGILPNQPIEPASGKRYIQSGTALITRVDLTNFYAFADTTESILINEASLVINNVSAPVGLLPPASMRMRFMEEDGDFSRQSNTATSAAYENYFFVHTINPNPPIDPPYFAVETDDGSANSPIALLEYEEEDARYSGMITLFAQSLFKNKADQDGINQSRLKYLGLYPQSPLATKSVNRAVYNEGDLKLRITYTRPTQINPE